MADAAQTQRRLEIMELMESERDAQKRERDEEYWCYVSVGILIFVVLIIAVLVAALVHWSWGASSSRIEIISGTGTGTGTQQLPYITPPVRQAAPDVFKQNSSTNGNTTAPARRRLLSASGNTLNAQTIVDRFFNPAGGPTETFVILEGVDGRITGINTRLSNEFSACTNTKPQAYNITTWGTNVTFYAQCAEMWQGNSGFDQFGIVGSDLYVYTHGGDGEVAAKVHNWNGTASSLIVTVWYSVGVINRNGSHGVVQILAKPNSTTFEMTAAGANIGFCGAQLHSDGQTLYVIGSEDMGATCSEIETSCTLASSLTTSSTQCNGTTTQLTLPALGRKAYGNGQYGASQYPGPLLDQVVLSNTGFDDTFFGPNTPSVTPI